MPAPAPATTTIAPERRAAVAPQIDRSESADRRCCLARTGRRQVFQVRRDRDRGDEEGAASRPSGVSLPPRSKPRRPARSACARNSTPRPIRRRPRSSPRTKSCSTTRTCSRSPTPRSPKERARRSPGRKRSRLTPTARRAAQPTARPARQRCARCRSARARDSHRHGHDRRRSIRRTRSSSPRISLPPTPPRSTARA